MSDPKQAFYAHEAREFLRKKLIGKHVRVSVDFIRPRDGEFEEREAATVRFGGANSYVLEVRLILSSDNRISGTLLSNSLRRALRASCGTSGMTRTGHQTLTSSWSPSKRKFLFHRFGLPCRA